MKIVLLPGLDGTGKLFSPLLPYLSVKEHDVIVLDYTLAQQQDYQSLVDYVQTRLPNEQFVLVAESFSGPIGAMLAGLQNKNLTAVIFVATFLSPPAKWLLKLSRLISIHKLLKLPLSSFLLNQFMFNGEAEPVYLKQVIQIIKGVPQTVFKQRLATVAELSLQTQPIDLPAVYLRAKSDRLVAHYKLDNFRLLFPNLTVEQVDGPHCLLQIQPEECAAVINRYLNK